MRCARSCRHFPDVAPGDVFIHNDPYQGGSHLPDVNVVAPAFHEGRLLGFGCVRAHWPDIGSATPGSYGAVTEIYGEGLRLPPIRLYRDGKPDPAIEAIIFANVRTPTERLGDLRAQVAANWRAAARLQALAAKYGTDTLLDIMQEVQDYSETMMRAALRALPDGEAEFTDVFDGDGVIAPGEIDDETFTVKLRIIKRGDTIVADFAGSDPQVPGPMNAPLTVTASGVFCALKMIADPKSLIPPNSGCWRPVTVTAPPGSVVNAQLPAPVVYANHEMSHRVADMVMAAMFAFTPRTVMAGSQGTSAVMTFGGTDYRTNERYVSYELVKGGFGARPVKDGINAVASTVSNMMNTPIEIVEMSFPLRVEEYALVPDSGGAGTWRGGLGVRRVWRVLERQAHAAVCCERTVTPPFGLDGGQPGAPAKLELIPPNGNARKLNSKGGFMAPAGSLVVIEAPGSGGYRPTFGARPRASFRRPPGWIRYPLSGAARLWCGIARRTRKKEMSGTQPVIAQKSPYRMEVEAGKSYWWCACGKSGNQPFCDGSHQRQRLHADRIQGAEDRHNPVLRLQDTTATSPAATERIGACNAPRHEETTMKIDDVSLTIFTWDGIPATQLSPGTATACTSNLGLLRIHTDEGLEGHAFLGSATNPASMDGPQLIRSLKPMLMGQNPLERERIHGAMRLVSRICQLSHDRRGRYCAVGPVRQDRETAGARADGHIRTSILAYASSQVLPDIARLCRPGADVSRQMAGAPTRSIRRVIRIRTSRYAQAVRKAVGDDFRLMLDSTWSYSYTDALRVGRAIEEMGYYWYEDPMSDEDIYNYVKLREKLDIPIMATEFPGRRTGDVSDLADRARHRLPAGRYPEQGRSHHHAEDRPSGGGVQHQIRNPPFGEFAEQSGQPPSLHGDPQHDDVRGAIARWRAQVRHGEGTGDRSRWDAACANRAGPGGGDRLRSDQAQDGERLSEFRGKERINTDYTDLYTMQSFQIVNPVNSFLATAHAAPGCASKRQHQNSTPHTDPSASSG